MVATAEAVAEVRGVTYEELERTVEANAARALRLVAAMVRLGQNFLADPNLLDAIVRDAELEPGRRRARGRGRGRGADRAAGRGGRRTSTRSRSTAASSRRWRAVAAPPERRACTGATR